jgi:hypothetical protein
VGIAHGLEVSYSLYEVPASPIGTPGTTFVVTHDGVVIFVREYMRHVRLVEKSPYSRSQIAWGGILTAGGEWVRRSFDFGDAPDHDAREFVSELLQKVLV